MERCIDSSRYFVLRIENESGRHMFIGVAFNERNDAFDFNTSLEDARLEREKEEEAQRMNENAQRAAQTQKDQHDNMGSKLGFSAFSSENKGKSMSVTDYSLKEGETIRVVLPGASSASSAQGGKGSANNKTNMAGMGTEAFQHFSNHDVPIEEETPQSSENRSAGWDAANTTSSNDRISTIKRKPKGKKGSSTTGLTFLKPCARDTPTRAQQKNT